MDDAYGYEERGDECEAQITVNGDYLWVQHEGGLRYVYRRVPEGAALLPSVSRTLYAGGLYSLAWVEDDA
jgi:hypothetical protein